MIAFVSPPEPPNFQPDVGAKGRAWLANNASNPGRPPAYWLAVREQLADGFGNLCAYCAMYEPVGTVDHFVSCTEDRQRAYDWSNYRFASGWINSSKTNLTSSEVLDPFDVEDGWFEILLPSLLLVATEAIPAPLREKAEFTIQRLHLVNDQRVIRQREEWLRMYDEKELSLEGLNRKAPLLARAIKKRDTGAGIGEI